MHQLSTVQINNELTEVRKAYRLLYQFQKRVLDILRFVERELAIDYYGGYAKFSAQTPAASFGTLDDSAWDWLNFYLYEFHFREEELRYRYHIDFSVFLVSDTGYFDIEGANVDNVHTFAPTEVSNTKLVFVLGQDAWLDTFDDFELNFRTDAPDYVRANKKGILLAKSFELDDFGSQLAAKQSLRSLLNFWQVNGIYEIKLRMH